MPVNVSSSFGTANPELAQLQLDRFLQSLGVSPASVSFTGLPAGFQQPDFSAFGGQVNPAGNNTFQLINDLLGAPQSIPDSAFTPAGAQQGQIAQSTSSPSQRRQVIDVPAPGGTIAPNVTIPQQVFNPETNPGLQRRDRIDVPALPETAPPPGVTPPATPPAPIGPPTTPPPGNLPPTGGGVAPPPPVPSPVVPPTPGPVPVTQNPGATFDPALVNSVLAPTVIAPSTFDASRQYLQDILTHQTGNQLKDIDLGQQGVTQAALGLGAGQIGLNDLLGPDVLRNTGQGSLLGGLLSGSATDVLNQPSGTPFDVSDPALSGYLSSLGLDPNAIDIGSLAESQLFGLLGGEFSPRGFQELQGATEGALNNFGANQQQVTEGIGQLIGQGATGGQLGQDLTGLLFGQLGQQFDPTQAVNPEVNQFVNSSLQNGGISPDVVAALKEQQFDPAREELLGDLAARGILDSSARLSFEEDLLRDQNQTLALLGLQGSQNAAQLGLQGSALEQQARAQENANTASLLGLGGGFQNQFSNQLANALGIGTTREGQAFGQGLSGFGATTDFSTGLLNTALQQQNIGQGLGLDAQALGLQQQQTGLGQLGLNQQAALQALAMQQGLFGDVRDFGATMQQFNQAQLSDNINAQLARELGLDQAAAARSSANKALIGQGIGAGAGIISAAIM